MFGIINRIWPKSEKNLGGRGYKGKIVKNFMLLKRRSEVEPLPPPVINFSEIFFENFPNFSYYFENFSKKFWDPPKAGPGGEWGWWWEVGDGFKRKGVRF